MSTPPGALAPHIIRQLLEEFRLGRWVEDAACNPDTGHLFFPTAGQHSGKAKAICEGCPVISECKDYAIKSPNLLRGVWGGMSEAELHDARRKAGTKVKQPLECGTPAGYRAHYREGQVPCAACRRAAAIERARYRAEKKAAAL